MTTREEALRNVNTSVERKPMNVQCRGRKVKKSLGKKLTEAFIEEDLGSVKDYILHDYLIPYLKNGLVNMATGAIEMIFNGERRGFSSSAGRTASNPSKTSYSAYYKSQKTVNTGVTSYRQTGTTNTGYRVNEMRFYTKKDILEFLDGMADSIHEYGDVSVATMYEAYVDENGVPIYKSTFTDNNWGFTSMDGIGYKPIGNEWLLILPKCESI